MAAPLTRVLNCDPASITFSGDKPVYSDPETEKAITSAVEHLKMTVYGLGALALDESAAAKIFATKGRPTDNPLIVHISSLSMLSCLLPPSYTPSPTYTPSRVPSIITAGHPTVAVRMPAHPVARALIAAIGAPLAAPSANASGKPSPTRATHVLRDLGTTGRLPLILDGGPCAVGLESTVVDGLGKDEGKLLRVLRPGGATVEALCDDDNPVPVPRVLVHRRDFVLERHEEDAPTTPGMKYRHYAPGVPVTLLYTTALAQTASEEVEVGTRRVTPDAFFREAGSGSSSSGGRVGLMAQDGSPMLARARSEGTRWLTFSLGEAAEPARAAQRLFEGLLSLEEQGVEQIYVEEVAEEREGLAFMNRVKKAAGESLRIVDL
ncbi:DHBP synthase RibB-like alpha/beta domain-containing protein [Lactifluus volemus]|nr:DHBP synthase RibB-like alpha/beta domain-containing protein [Lactifluus volemus]